MEDNFEPEYTEWYPQHVINGESSMAILILNQPFSDGTRCFVKEIWKSALYRVAVDGGTLHLKGTCSNEHVLIPDLICGDFDSLSHDVAQSYERMDVTIINTPDQNETDFTKALRLTAEHVKEKHLQVSVIVAVADNGGRLDHILGNLNTLYQALEISSMPVFLLGNNTFTWLLPPGAHRIHVSEVLKSGHVGLIPLGEECTDVTTTGLKWNLSNSKMKFGGLISICNKFDGSDVVTVKTKTHLIWTMEINLNTDIAKS